MTLTHTKLFAAVLLATSVQAYGSQPSTPSVGTTNAVTGSATSTSQGFTESFVSIGGNGTASQSATANTSGLANVTGSVSNTFAEVLTNAEQISMATATGSFVGDAGPSEFSPFSNAGAFSFSTAQGVATIPTITAPGNSGNTTSGGN